MHLRLIKPLNKVLHRIFQTHDIVLYIIEHTQKSVEGRGFARSGRTGQQDKAVRALDNFFHQRQIAPLHP